MISTHKLYENENKDISVDKKHGRNTKKWYWENLIQLNPCFSFAKRMTEKANKMNLPVSHKLYCQR